VDDLAASLAETGAFRTINFLLGGFILKGLICREKALNVMDDEMLDFAGFDETRSVRAVAPTHVPRC